jgi:ATP-binding cassette subfamily B protein
LVEIYLRALRYLLADGKRVAAICGANVVLAGVAIAEPILFGRIVDSITEGSDVMQTVALSCSSPAVPIVWRMPVVQP